MSARSIQHLPAPKFPVLATTIIAKWWPGRYYWVSTICLSAASDSPEMRLARGLGTLSSSREATLIKDRYFTQGRYDQKLWMAGLGGQSGGCGFKQPSGLDRQRNGPLL